MSQTTNQQTPTADPTNRSSNQHAETDLDLDLDLGLDLDRGDSDSTKISVTANPLEKQMIEALCYEFYDSSQSAVLTHVAVQAYFENAGRIHPGAILSDELEEITPEAIRAGEIDADDLPEEYTLESETDAFDLGDQDNRGRANSYTPTFTPDDLSKEGRALTWDELKDAVDRHWGPDLEIHPDRVDAERLKQNRKFNAKVIAGMLRSETDVVPHALIDERIEEYLGHQIERADYDAGLEYKTETHKPLVVDHLEEHPNIKVEAYFSSTEALESNLPSYASRLIEELESNYAPTIETWQQHNPGNGKAYTSEFELLDDWLDQLAEFRETLPKLTALTGNGDFTEVLEDSLEYDTENFENAASYLVHIYKKMKEEYKRAPEHARYVVWNEYADLDDSSELPCDQPTEALMDFAPYENDDGRMELDDRFTIVANNLDG